MQSTPANDDELDWVEDYSRPIKTTWTSQQTKKHTRTYGTYGGRSNTNRKNRRQQQQQAKHRQSSIILADKFCEDSEGPDSSHNSFNSSDCGYERTSSSSFGSDAALATASINYPDQICSNSNSSSTVTTSMTSSASSGSRRETKIPPLRPSKKVHRRSISACIPPKIPRPLGISRACSTTSRSTITSSITSVLQGYDEENVHPNELNEIGEAPSPPQLGRKNIRLRRSSMSSGGMTPGIMGGGLKRGTSVPVFNHSHSMSTMDLKRGHSVPNVPHFPPSHFSMDHMDADTDAEYPPPPPAAGVLSRRNSMPNLDGVDKTWLQGSSTRFMGTPPPGPVSAAALGRYDSGELTDATATSPGCQSISACSFSSSRKRGMSEEPSEANDDTMSIAGTFSAPRTSFRCNSASRACKVLSPMTGFSAAKRTTSDSSSHSRSCYQGATLTYTTVKLQDENAFVGSGRATNLESDSEDDDSDNDDFSMGSSSTQDEKERDDEASPTKSLPGAMKPVRTKEDVLRTMPSYQDLKFLIQKLKGEKQKHGKNPIHERKTYIVKLPQNQGWSAERRDALLHWASKGVGLTPRASNASDHFLQTPAAKGVGILDLLFSALVLYKEREQEGQQLLRPVVEKLSFSLDKSSDLDVASSAQGNTPARAVADCSAEESTDAFLIEGMGALTFKEKAKAHRFIQQVTVDDEPASNSVELVIDLLPQLRTSRPSMDSHCSSDNDFAFHMPGYSPAAPSGRPIRPPKMSFGSVSSVRPKTRQTAHNNGMHTGSSSVMSICPPSSVNYATPLNKPANWGSQPVAGKDWGNSQECDDAKLFSAVKALNSALHEAGLYDSKEDAMADFIAMQTRQSADLCLDLEVGCCDEESDSDDEYFSDGARSSDEVATIIDNKEDNDMDTINFDTIGELPSAEKLRDIRRRHISLAKHTRMSVCVTSSSASSIYQRKSLFAKTRQSCAPSTLSASFASFNLSAGSQEPLLSEPLLIATLAKENLLSQILCFLEGSELLTSVSLVSQAFADASTDAYAELMLASVGCTQDGNEDGEDAESVSLGDDDDEIEEEELEPENSIALSMQRPWDYLLTNFPFGSFLSEGAFKRVYKVKNSRMGAAEAVSIMDVEKIASTGNKSVVATELAVSIMLGSLARRQICPNFVVTRGVFTCPFEPPVSLWGSAENKNHQVHVQSPKAKRIPKQPAAKHEGRFQYIRMELCTEGDAEEFIKDQPNELLPIEMTRMMLFQISFALHAAASKFSLKHYDLKLLNIFLQGASNVPGANLDATGDVVLRYGLGSKNFALPMPVETALLAKLADYGTADVKAQSNGQPLSLAQITTPENTPPDFLILGDAAKQGHEHDLFGLGLCMLHLFTGKAPYEEILEDVVCPPAFRAMLQFVWEDDNVFGYSVVRSFVLSEVYRDDEGNITEGEADDTFYDTLYRFLVLFGIPEHKFQRRQHGKVWKAIVDCLGATPSKRGKDYTRFAQDQGKYSLAHGTNTFIARARRNLKSMDGAMELLKSLVDFDPEKRATALEVLNSEFFTPLIEAPGVLYRSCDDVRSYTAFAT